MGSIQFIVHVFDFHQTLIKSSDLMLRTNFKRSYITAKYCINKSTLAGFGARGSLAAASDKDYQLLAHGQWFSPGTPASCTTKTGRHDIAEILVKVALNTNNQINLNHLNQFHCINITYVFVILNRNKVLCQ